jgi:AraC-like DNA-binding protein
MLALNRAGTTSFVQPAEPLRKYITTYYFFELETPGEIEQEDLVHPEWASIRYVLSGQSRGSFMPDPLQELSEAVLVGPSTRARRIGCVSARIAGLGITPLGWFRLIKVNASLWANQSVDVRAQPEFAVFARIWETIRGLDDYAEMARRMDEHLIAALAWPDPREAKVAELHDLLTNPDFANVGELADALDMDVQQVERLTRRAFGFAPKRLIRRQRFLRTLAQRLLDPELNWSGAMDSQYYDQAHFNRDFKEFMGMSPREYLAMPRPISKGSATSRAEQVGQPLQGLDRPTRGS